MQSKGGNAAVRLEASSLQAGVAQKPKAELVNTLPPPVRRKRSLQTPAGPMTLLVPVVVCLFVQFCFAFYSGRSASKQASKEAGKPASQPASKHTSTSQSRASSNIPPGKSRTRIDRCITPDAETVVAKGGPTPRPNPRLSLAVPRAAGRGRAGRGPWKVGGEFHKGAESDSPNGRGGLRHMICDVIS